MSKTRRKVTVEGDKSSDEEGGSGKRNKPSVFERLGPGATSSRKSFEGERSDLGLYQEKCRNWLKTGSCHYGSACRFIHGPFTSGRSKRKGEGEEDSGDESKHRKHRAEKDKHKRKSQSLSPKRLGRSHGRKDKDAKMKSAVIVKKSVGGGADSERESDSTPWEAEDNAFEDLDYKDELQLEQKRQELERVLRQLQPSEEERENITIEKKQISSSSGSSSSSSGSSSSSSSSSSGSPSPPRRKSPRRPKTPPRRSPPRHHGKSPPPLLHDRSPSYRDKVPPAQERSPLNRDPSPQSHRERAPRRETTPPPGPPRERSPPSSPPRPPSPRRPTGGWSPEKISAHGPKGGKLIGKKKKLEKQKEKSRSRGGHLSSPTEWEQPDRDREKDIEKRRTHSREMEKFGHKEKHRRRNRSPFLDEKPKPSGRDTSMSPGPRARVKPKSMFTPSPEPDPKKSEVPSRHDTGSEYDSPLPKSSRRSVSPVKERSKRGKRRGRTLSVSPLRTKKLSPGPPKSKDILKEPEKELKKEKTKGGSMDPIFHSEKSMEPIMKERSRVRSPAQASGKGEKHKKRKDSSEKKKRHDSPDLTPPPKTSRKRKESPETPVKSSKRASKEKGAPETPGRRLSKSKSAKRKESRKVQKGQGDWEQSPSEMEEKSRGRGDGDSSRRRPNTPEMPPTRGREKRRSSPPEPPFDGRSRSGGDSRRPGTPLRRPESPPEIFRPGMRTPPRFARSSREDSGFAAGMRHRSDEEFGRPPGSASPTGRRGREGRYREDFEPGLGRRDPDPEGPNRMDRFVDPRDRDRMGRFPELRPPLYDEGPTSRLEQERLFDMDRARYERETDRFRRRDGFERERFGRDRFPGRPDRFEDGRGQNIGGRDPRGLGVSGPPWEREFGSGHGGGMGSRGMSGDRFSGRGGFDEDIPDRLSRRGEWEGRHMDFREEWGPRGRDDRREMRVGRRGEFLEMRDERRFDGRMDDQGMFRRMDRDEMLRMRLEGDFRDRREPSDPRENPYSDLRRDERGDRRDRVDRGDEGFDRGRHDERMDERMLRREERESRIDRREGMRKRPFDHDEDKPPSPPPKRVREHSPSVTSLRSHSSKLEEARGSDWDRERVESRRRDQFQDTDVARRERDQDNDRLGKRARDAERQEGERMPRDKERGRSNERDGNQDGDKDSIRGRGRERERERDADGKGTDGEQLQEKRRKGDELERSVSRKRVGDRSRCADEEREGKGMVKTKEEGDRGEEEKGRSQSSKSEEGEEREADRESAKSGSKDSIKDQELLSGRLSHRETDRESGGNRSWPRDRSRDKDRDSMRDRDRETQSEKGLSRGRESRDGDDNRSLSSRSQHRDGSRDRSRSEHGDGDRNRGRGRRRRGIHLAGKGTDGDRDDTESEKGSSKGSLKDPLKSAILEGQSDTGEKDGKMLTIQSDKPDFKAAVSEAKGDISEKYDPFAPESDEEPGERPKGDNSRPEDKSDEGDAGQKQSRQKRLLTPEPLSSQNIGDGERKKQKMIELSEGTITETAHPEQKAEAEHRKEVLPFTGEVSDKEELKSAGGEVYSDWSSADDADDILGRPEAIPFTNQSKLPDIGNGDSQSIHSNLDRRRRSASRSSHGSKRDIGRDDRGREQSYERGREQSRERGRERSRDDRMRDDRGRLSRASSRHSSYDRHRDDRRRYGSTEPTSTSQAWDRNDVKPEIPQSEDNKPQNANQAEDEDNADKSDLFGTSMDYETISDDGDIGDEEEEDGAKGVVSALQIDWSSLTKDHRTTPQPGSALQRFKPASIFQRIGIEKSYAGEKLLEKLKKLCQAQLDEGEVPQGSGENGEKTVANGKEDSEAKKTAKFQLHHDIAAFHASTMYKQKERSNLFRNIGTFRRALCARKDLDIRRQLCKLDKIEIRRTRHSQKLPVAGQT